MDGIEYINHGSPITEIPFPYMKDLINRFEKEGYTRGLNLRAATYDFRTAGAS